VEQRVTYETLVERCATALDTLAQWAACHDGRVAAVISSQAVRLRDPQMRVAFYGRFSAGKSSVINCALGRRLMPVSDLPENGVPCWLSHGSADTLSVHRRDGTRRDEPCSPDSISRFVSLQTQEGPANPELEDVERVEITLSDFSGAAVRWIDTPGLDSGRESERAEQVRQEADLVLWVLGTRTFLSEIEARAIARHIALAGPLSIILVLNAFLKEHEDPAAQWRQVLEEQLPVYRKRIADRGNEVGLGGDWSPQLVVLSAEQALLTGGGFGGQSLRELLAIFDAPGTPASAELRLARAAHELLQARAMLEAGLAACQVDTQSRAAEIAAQDAQLHTERGRARRYVADAISAYVARMGVAASSIGEEVARSITTSVERDGVYGKRVSAGLSTASSAARADVLARLRNVPAPWSWDTSDWEQEINRMLVPSNVKVTVANNPAKMDKASTGAVIGGLLGLLGGPVGVVVGASVGGMFSSGKAAVAKDIEETRKNVIQAARAEAESLQRWGDKALDYCLEHLQCNVPTLPQPDTDAETDLRELLSELDRLRSVLMGVDGPAPA
jgi:hypothetical protein